MSQSTYRQPGESPAATPPSGMLVSHTPVAMAQRAARFRAMLIRRTIGLGISALISVAWWLLFRPEPWSFLFCLLVGSVLYSLVWVIVNFVQLKWARKVTSRVPLGPAFQIDTHGIVLATRAEGERIGWPEVNLVAGRNKLFDPGPVLQFNWGEQGTWSVPIIVLDAPPSSIDSALRAFSLGRFGMDLSSTDDIW